MLRRTCTTALATVALLSAGPAPAQNQRNTGPVATYWMTARTTSGLPTGGAGFDPMAMLSGGSVDRSLSLQLQAERAAVAPEAEHQPPAGLNTGILPLRTPAGRSTVPDFDPRSEMPTERARMLIFHGCGEQAGPGQPLVIDISTDNPAGATGQMSALMEAIRLSPEAAPSPGPGRTYGEWPNERSTRSIPADGSLVGAHLVSGNYTPDIRFELGADQDFMEAVRLSGTSDGGSLGWNAVGGARGYFATTMGSNESGDLVIWTSSDVPVPFGLLPDILSPADLERLIRQGVVLPASTTRCPIPEAVQTTAPESILRVVAFGGEVNFSHPPRPTDPREVWNIEHVVKVRYTSGVSTILGMDMTDLMGGDEDEDQARRPATPYSRPPAPNPARALRGILGGIIRQP